MTAPTHAKPRLLLTIGDVAGVGPEILAKAWPALVDFCRPVVVGDLQWMRRGARVAGLAAEPVAISPASLGDVVGDAVIPVLPATDVDLTGVSAGVLSAAGGRAAFDFLCRAIDLTLAKEADAIVTCPLQKEGLHAAGLRYPGHTEILAERTGVREFGMMLYARAPEIPQGLGVIHVTLHMALREVFANITRSAIEEKVRILHVMMNDLCDCSPKLGVAALNPHASDGGLFGNEEAETIAPAVEACQKAGLPVTGPWPSDTLFVRARKGEFDGIVAMYHDQGHIPLKLLTGLVGAVNITVGLPIVRTSVAHGTAYDIAGKGVADERSLVEAARIAARLAERRRARRDHGRT